MHASKSRAVLNDADPIETRFYIVGADEPRVVSYDCDLLVLRHEQVTDFLLLSFLKRKSRHKCRTLLAELENSDCTSVVAY